jgi:hypothetical protein
MEGGSKRIVGGSKATSLESEDGSTGSSDPSKKHRKDEAEASQTDRKNPLGAFGVL